MLGFIKFQYLTIKTLNQKKIIRGDTVDMCESLIEFYADDINQGIKEESINKTKQLFEHFYPNDDSSIIDNLTTEQCDQVFTMLLENKPLKEIINKTIYNA